MKRHHVRSIVIDFLTTIDEDPSQCTNAFWIYAINSQLDYPTRTARGGKWLIFRDISEIDDAWRVVKEAVKNGKLGKVAKVSTKTPNRKAMNPNTKVICVYTYDSDDVNDVMRVRKALAELGFVEPLPYKTDIATFDDKYSVKGDKRISKYYE